MVLSRYDIGENMPAAPCALPKSALTQKGATYRCRAAAMSIQDVTLRMYR